MSGIHGLTRIEQCYFDFIHDQFAGKPCKRQSASHSLSSSASHVIALLLSAFFFGGISGYVLVGFRHPISFGHGPLCAMIMVSALMCACVRTCRLQA